MNAPSLSIVIPTRNRCRLLARCLHSLMLQDAPPQSYEVVVVDDGSRDDTATHVRGMPTPAVPVRYVRQPGRGISAARNTGLRASRGSFIAFVADDYVLPPGYVSHALRFFEREPRAGAVRFAMGPAEADHCSRVAHFYFDVDLRNNLDPAPQAPALSITQGVRKLARRLPSHGDEPTERHRLSASGGAVFRASVFDVAGLFDERLARAEDSDFARRMRRLALPLHFDPTLIIRRSYEDSIVDAFRAESAAGYHVARFEATTHEASVAHHLARAVLRLAGRPLWRARQCDSLTQSVTFLPMLCWLELAHFRGFVRGALTAPANH